MALRTIRTQGDEVLEKVCRPIAEVTPRIRTLAEDMVETCGTAGRHLKETCCDRCRGRSLYHDQS